ncbi:putative lipoprotein [Tenacibaculum sp. 190130A14a]|uniref:Lipoprotein n=1 Tax=Tenacibaculum polynesiense TaxID=3137857 RepID=A0ABM9P7R0_9FLAO
MKHLQFLLVFVFLFQSCIDNDIINDTVEEKLSINNPIQELTINNTYQYTTKYTDNVGNVQAAQISWNSSDPAIISVSSTGLITAFTKGTATITASTTSSNGATLSTSNTVTATEDMVDNSGPKEKTGTIRTTSSYTLTGTFTLKEIPNTNDLELIVNDDYRASSSLPGLFLYLTNNSNTVSGAKEISAVSVFNGAHTYTIKDTKINDFSHLLYWCKPFSVKVGDAEIN